VAVARPDPERSAPRSPRGAWRDPLSWTIAALLFGAYFALSAFRLLRLDNPSWDLGIFTEVVKQYAHLHAPVVDLRTAGFNELGEHFTVALVVLAPFFRLFPTPMTLLFFQALLTAVSVFPVVTAGTALAGRSAGRLIGFAYGLSWGLQQMIFFDFHEIALAVPLLAFSISALVRQRWLTAAAWAVPLVLVKEDQGFTVAAIGFYLLFVRVRRAGLSAARVVGGPQWIDVSRLTRAGLFLVIWGLAWSIVEITVLIPYFNPQHAYSFWKNGGAVGGGSPLSVASLASQTAASWPIKLQTVVMLLLPTAFAALGSPVALLGLPSLALRFVSTNNLFWGIDYHYNATIMPILFIAAIEALGRWQASWRTRSAGAAISGDLGPANTGPASTGPASTGPAVTGPAVTVGARWSQPLAVAWRTVTGRVAAGLRIASDGLAGHGAPVMAGIAVTFVFQFPLSGLWQPATYTLDAHVAAADAAMAVVPDGATVLTTTDLLAPLGARTDTFWLGNPGNPVTQYIVFDGDNSGYPASVSANVPAFIRQLYPDAGYAQVYARDNVYVFKRRLPRLPPGDGPAPGTRQDPDGSSNAHAHPGTDRAGFVRVPVGSRRA
jgi:uncharacterized membrane protein